jgi:hypothetical protein
MATFLGKLGVVKSGANTVGEVTDFSVTTSAVITADPSLGDDWATNKAATKSWTATINANFDYGDTTGQNTLNEGDEVSVELYPVDDTATNLKLSGSLIVSGNTITNSGNDGVVSLSISGTGNGALTKEAVV